MASGVQHWMQCGDNRSLVVGMSWIVVSGESLLERVGANIEKAKESSPKTALMVSGVQVVRGGDHSPSSMSSVWAALM